MQNQSLRYTAILLSQVVHQSSKKGTLRERLAVMASEFSERLRGKFKNHLIHIELKT